MVAATCIATALEKRRPFPVDALVPEPIFASTHAIAKLTNRHAELLLPCRVSKALRRNCRTLWAGDRTSNRNEWSSETTTDHMPARYRRMLATSIDALRNLPELNRASLRY